MLVSARRSLFFLISMVQDYGKFSLFATGRHDTNTWNHVMVQKLVREMGKMAESRHPMVKTGRSVSNLLEDIETRFKAIAGHDEQIDVEELQSGLGLKDPEYARRIFALVDSDGGGTVSLWEFIDFANVLIDGSADQKLRIIFDLHDLNGDGTIDPREMKTILDRSLNEHALELSEDALASLSNALFRSVDTDSSGDITFSEFLASINRHPTLRDQMVNSSATWLSLPQRISADRRKRPDGFSAAWESISRLWANNRPWLVLLTLYAIANIWMFRSGLMVEAANGSDLPTQIAQGAAEALKLNGAVILFAMLRNTFTFLRKTPLKPFLPLDEAIAFHKVVGHVTFGLAVVHVGGYLWFYESMVSPDFFTRDLIYGGLIKSQVGWSGLTLIGIFLVIWIFSLEMVRRKGLFELFHITHQLFWLWFVFFLFHVPDFWQWVILPGILYIGERVVRLARARAPTEMKSLDALPSNVSRILMTRPERFAYQPGEYVFARIPAISKREWHPFTITSSPEDPDALELHIRSVGTWTKRLHQLAASPEEARSDDWNTIYLDGPYGSPAAEIFESKVPVLIGAGIGVTPFASILRSILHRRRMDDPLMAHIEGLYFVWLNRDQQAFEWFVSLIAEIEEDPATREFISIQVNLTGLRAELTSASLTIALEVYHETTGRDLLTGLQTQTSLSRPNWSTLFKEIGTAHDAADVDVFFCGPESLSRVLADVSNRFGFGYKKENF